MTENGRVVVITGGNRGIGADLTRRFLDDGFQVVNISRKAPEFSHERLSNYEAGPRGAGRGGKGWRRHCGGAQGGVLSCTTRG